MCEVVEMPNGWEVNCNGDSRLILFGCGIMVEGCALSYHCVEGTCPRLPSGVHVAFEKESVDPATREKLKLEYCRSCPYKH